MWIIIIIAVFILLYFLSRTRNKPAVTNLTTATTAIPVPEATAVYGTYNTEEPLNAIPPGFLVMIQTTQLERKTFIKGQLTAKYYGELDTIKYAEDFVREQYYDFTIYEALVQVGEFRRNNDGPFPPFPDNTLFAGQIRPQPLPVFISQDGIEGNYAVLLHDTRLANIYIDPKLHQTEDEEVFGTLHADITGYVLEHFTKEEEILVPEEVQHTVTQMITLPPAVSPAFTATTGYTPTGQTKITGRYQYEKLYNIHTQKSQWGNRKFQGSSVFDGCAQALGFLFSIFIVTVLIASAFPYSLVVIAIIGLLLLLSGYFAKVLLWFMRVGLAVLLILALIYIVQAAGVGSRSTGNSPVVKDRADEQSKVVSQQDDSLIVHHRVWQDYSGQTYSGDYSVRVSNLRQSSSIKRNFPLHPDPVHSYDAMLAGFYANDINRLQSLFTLFDSLRVKHQLGFTAFAEMIVSFVQDIPYTLVLDNDCDPAIYADPKVQEYLFSHIGPCEGFQRFGINTPVEFLSNLKGDCDSRTLLLFSILSHYHYRTAILSSETFAHSVLGVDLPIPGLRYRASTGNYLVWETTSVTRPGLLPDDVNDLNQWRISLHNQ